MIGRQKEDLRRVIAFYFLCFKNIAFFNFDFFLLLYFENVLSILLIFFLLFFIIVFLKLVCNTLGSFLCCTL